MFRYSVAAVLLPLLLGPAVAAPAPVGKPPTDLPVPATALVVAQVQGVERVRGRLEKMLKAAAPDVAEVAAAQFDSAVNSLLNGRDIKALAPDSRVFVVMTGFDPNAAEPPVAVLVPVKDVATFKEKLLTDDERKSWERGRDGVYSFDVQDRAMYAASLPAGGYVAVARDKAVAETFAGKFAPLTPTQMGEAFAEAFLSADVSVYANLDQVNEDYGDKIRQGKQLFQLLMQQGMAMGGGVDKRQAEMAKVVFDVLFQAAEDGRGVALGVTFKPEGLAVRADAAFASDSPTAKGLAQEQPAATPGLADLPGGLTAYNAGRIGPKLAAAMAQLNQEFRAEDGDDKAAGVVAKFNDLSAEATAYGFVTAGSAPGSAIAVLTPADPAAFVAARVKALKALTPGAAFMNVALKEKPAVAEDAESAGGFKLTRANLTLDFDATVKGIPDANLRATTIASMKRMIKENTTFWFGTDGKRVVTVTAADWPAAEKLLTEYTSGKGKVGTDKAFQATRDQLPADASVVSLTEVNRILVMLSDSFADLTETIPGLPFGKLPKLKASEVGNAYLGMAVGLKPTAVRFDLFVPADAVKVARAMFKPVLGKEE